MRSLLPTNEKLARLLDCDTPEIWGATLCAIAKDCGFDRIAFWAEPNRIAKRETILFKSTYPDQWLATYDKSRFYSVDPVIGHCRGSMLPIVWEPTTFKGRKQREFYEQACGYGLKSGIAYPAHGMSGKFGLLSFATDNAKYNRKHFNELATLSLIRDYALASSAKFLRDVSPTQLKLTPRETECLQWILVGKSSWETSMILGVSQTTVNFHAQNAMEKCGVHTRREAAVMALQAGYITF